MPPLTKAAIFVLGAALIPIKAHNTPSQPAPKTVTPDQYMTQVTKSNAALAVYLKTPCDDKDIEAVTLELAKQIDNLKEAYQDTPDVQDTLVQTQQTEILIGFEELVHAYVPLKSKVCKELKSEPPPPQDDPHNTKS